MAAENTPIGEFRRFAIGSIRGNRIRGHDENAPDHGNSAIAVGVDNAPPASLTTIRPRRPIDPKYFEDGERHSTIGNYP
jgi:hypothetical protein